MFSNAAAVAESPAPGSRRLVAVRDCRSVRASDLVRNGLVGDVEVTADGSRVTWNGDVLTMDPVSQVPISRLHFW